MIRTMARPYVRLCRYCPVSVALGRWRVAFNVEIEIGAEPTVAPVYPGLFKGGSYGYPDVHIDGQTMRVVVSRAKEKIVGYEFQLPGAE